MRPHPRLRKTIKWAGLAASIALAAVFVASGRWQVVWWSPNQSSVAVSQGWLEFNQINGALGGLPAPGWWVERADPEFQFHLWFHWVRPGNGQTLCVPIWVLAVPTLLAFAAAWRLDSAAKRRSKAGLCSHCRYDRRGLAPDAICPECGAAAPAPPSARS